MQTLQKEHDQESERQVADVGAKAAEQTTNHE